MYTFEQMSTLLARIEACLNSRPLTPLRDDPEDLVAITPAQLIGTVPMMTLSSTTDLPERRTHSERAHTDGVGPLALGVFDDAVPAS